MAGVYLSEAPPPPLLGFCLEWSSNFVGSESGQIQSVKLLQNTHCKKCRQTFRRTFKEFRPDVEKIQYH
jgi:hypothetical protein